MALTKAKLIADGVIDVDNLAAGHSITTSNIGEGSNLYYTDARVASYLTTNSYATESFVATGYLPLSGGNITGNFTVDTNTLYVDTTENTVSIRTTSNPYALNIGSTSDSDNTINLVSSTTGINRLMFSDSNNGQGVLLYDHTSDYLSFIVNDGERMHVISSGNVGIGTSSPSTKLDVNSGDTNVVAAFRSTDANASIGFADPSTTLDEGYPTVLIGASGNEMRLLTSNTERMRIDSSGRVGIGTSDPYTDFQVAGKGSFGSGGSSALGVEVMTVTAVPSGQVRGYIAAASSAAGGGNGDLLIASRTSAGTHIRFFAGTNSETVRFQSGGGISFNGDTAAANALDDYEEGTFTPEVADAATGGNLASGNFSGRYTKIGNLVQVNYVLGGINTTGLTLANDLYLRNLPFTISSATGSNPQGAIRSDDVNFSGDYIVAWGQTGSQNISIANVTSGSPDGRLNVSSISSGITDIIISLSYFV